jgi:hypothetical protein
MLVAAGTGTVLPRVSRWIAVKPMASVGDLSYSLYLWHWPIIVVALTLVDPLPVWLGLVAVSISFLPAWLTKKLIEDPVRLSDWFRPLHRSVYIGVSCSFVGLVGAWALFMAPTPAILVVADSTGGLASPEIFASTAPPTTSQGGGQSPVVEAPDVITPDVITPDPIDAKSDFAYDRDCQAVHDSAELARCDYGDPNGQFLIVLTGDSHAAQWLGPLDLISQERGWKLIMLTKGSCPYAEVTVAQEAGGAFVRCDEFNKTLVTELTTKLRPDLVITSNSREYAVMVGDDRLGPTDGRLFMVDGLHRAWTELLRNGIPVIPILDTPRLRINVPECVLEAASYVDECSVPTVEAMEGNTAQLIAAEVIDLPLIDMTDQICTRELCRPVEFGVLVWRDSNHLTNTYALLLQGELGTRIDAAFEMISRKMAGSVAGEVPE